ncbi:ribose-phosphate pyrophosphokinase [Haliangium ochraceum]|uniref:Ribose-phosphate pyrophosphokinase n=1 Tax=Haliangium ochraceum (strain DSM 14365 / JCM 11303 / SMP-2) TaxID=502025 RepID=D0LPV7_HALO1|nr:ribose-phosphate pyrophosphokinase [Haliangium ochraceum]ACY16994.1 ribose-phosphate pyrophosphokinase [Haliangium ochraceum DSM 14365]
MIKALSIFSGNSNRGIAEEICKYVEIPVGRANVTHFSDGEIYVELAENVRGVNCFVVQSTCTPVNNGLMELLIMIDALRRASAGSIVAVVPYFGYARQDRKAKPRTPITAKLVANLISAAGATRVVSMDLHAGQIQGFFDIPFDHLFGMPVFIEELQTRGYVGDDLVVVSPDAGGVERARAYSKRLGSSLAIIDKRRPKPNVSEVMNIIGDVKNRRAVLVDDIIDTAGTLTAAATAVMEAGAKSVIACGTHPVFSGNALERIEKSPLSEVIVSNTIPMRESGEHANVSKIRVKSVGRLLGEAVKRIHHGDSISSLFI